LDESRLSVASVSSVNARRKLFKGGAVDFGSSLKKLWSGEWFIVFAKDGSDDFVNVLMF
jgi:hypothetical protein